MSTVRILAGWKARVGQTPRQMCQPLSVLLAGPLYLQGVECLAAALETYTGAVLLVSHDQVRG